MGILSMEMTLLLALSATFATSFMTCRRSLGLVVRGLSASLTAATGTVHCCILYLVHQRTENYTTIKLLNFEITSSKHMHFRIPYEE